MIRLGLSVCALHARAGAAANFCSMIGAIEVQFAWHGVRMHFTVLNGEGVECHSACFHELNCDL